VETQSTLVVKASTPLSNHCVAETGSPLLQLQDRQTLREIVEVLGQYFQCAQAKRPFFETLNFVWLGK
jgi:hypothetical protein